MAVQKETNTNNFKINNYAFFVLRLWGFFSCFDEK